MDKSQQHHCKVCGGLHERGNELKYSQRFKAYVHEKCKTTCIRCRKPKDPEGFVCDGCEDELKAARDAVELPAPVHTAIDLSDRARHAAKSKVTGKSYPVRVHHRDDE